jgi:hypothetical protein
MSVDVIESQATEAYSNMGLSKAKFSSKYESEVEKEYVIVQTRPSKLIGTKCVKHGEENVVLSLLGLRKSLTASV